MSRVTDTFARLVASFGTPVARRWLLAPAAALALAGPAVARAGDRDRYDRDYDNRLRRVDVNIRIGEPRPDRRHDDRFEEREVRVWVPPVHRTVRDRKWVEPVYRTVSDRRWCEPVYETVCDRVWVPDVYETREVRYRHNGHWHTRCDRVLVRAGHYETRERPVCVREGRWETVERRECVSEGRWETIEREECVAEGRYDYRTDRVPATDRGHRHDRRDLVSPPLAGLGVQFNR